MTSTDHTTSAERSPAPLENLRIRGVTKLITPAQIKEQLPVDARQQALVTGHREAARRIVRGEDSRFMVVVGPCSIHDPEAALEYAARLAKVARDIEDRALVVMRVYFEKPRTTVGWKGLINDPHMDESCDVAHGLALARKLLLDMVDLGLPTASEFLDPIIPQYTADLISWAAVGARTTESQTHREMSSGLSMPVGFKNGTDGSVQTAIDAMQSSRSPHSFLGIDQDGFTSIVKTAGNPDCHIVLRGGRDGTNYEPEKSGAIIDQLKAKSLPASVMIDCSHANSGKDPMRQPVVWNSVVAQRKAGQREVIGAMLESNLFAGNQAVSPGRKGLRYGVSVTDGCIDWELTESLLRAL